MDKTEIYKKAIKIWGEKSQIIQAVEELAELIESLCKYENRSNETTRERYKNDVAEEIADVEIMLETIRTLFDMDYRINTIKEEKLERMEDILLSNSCID